MLFTADAHPGLASGAITVTFRSWRRPQAKVGGQYRVGDTVLVVDEVRPVRVGDITDDDARRAGAEDRHEIVARLSSRARGRYAPAGTTDVHSDTLVWRVDFHRVGPGSAPRLVDQDSLTVEDVAEITRRLDRLDAASPHGPWTRQTLDLIADRPAVVSTELAETVGRERQAFKTDVRKLKRLGLTESLDVGYRLSPRGHAYRLAVRPSSGRRRR